MTHRIGWLTRLAVVSLTGCLSGPVANKANAPASSTPASGSSSSAVLSSYGCSNDTAPTFYSVARVLLNARKSSSSGSRARGNERIDVGSHGARMLALCDIPRCPPGTVAVDNPLSANSGDSDGCGGPMFQCVPPPPTCTDGTYPEYVASAAYPDRPGQWKCSGPCDTLVQFGSSYSDLPVCTGTPPDCSGGTTPTLSPDSSTWQCTPDCSGGDYDHVDYDGVDVCIPC